MKKIILTTILLIASGYIYSQDWSPSVYRIGELVPGYIIKANGEKVEGFCEAQLRYEANGIGNSNQTRVIFYLDKNDKKGKKIYKPDSVKEYLIGDKVYKTMNYSGGLTSKPLRFVLRTKEACIGEYVWYNSSDPYEVHLYQKADEKPFETSYFATNYAEKMSKLVSEDTELAQKVSNKEKGYGLLKLLDVIAEYNKWCSENNK